MKIEMEKDKLNGKLSTLKEIIGEMDSDIVMLINFSAQIENGLKKKKNFSIKQVNSLERKLNRIIKTYFKKNKNKK
jgi:hypothetical protein